jgi:hypothetical protein
LLGAARIESDIGVNTALISAQADGKDGAEVATLRADQPAQNTELRG